MRFQIHIDDRLIWVQSAQFLHFADPKIVIAEFWRTNRTDIKSKRFRVYISTKLENFLITFEMFNQKLIVHLIYSNEKRREKTTDGQMCLCCIFDILNK